MADIWNHLDEYQNIKRWVKKGDLLLFTTDISTVDRGHGILCFRIPSSVVASPSAQWNSTGAVNSTLVLELSVNIKCQTVMDALIRLQCQNQTKKRNFPNLIPDHQLRSNLVSPKKVWRVGVTLILYGRLPSWTATKHIFQVTCFWTQKTWLVWFATAVDTWFPFRLTEPLKLSFWYIVYWPKIHTECSVLQETATSHNFWQFLSDLSELLVLLKSLKKRSGNTNLDLCDGQSQNYVPSTKQKSVKNLHIPIYKIYVSCCFC